MYSWFTPTGLLCSVSEVQKAGLERHKEITPNYKAFGRASQEREKPI